MRREAVSLVMSFDAGRDRFDSFADALSSLGNPVRLAILAQLGSPKTLSEIRVQSLARQTLRTHLDKLLEAGVVSMRETTRPYGETREYVLNQQALYGLSEEFRELAAIRPDAISQEATMPRSAATAPFSMKGPCLVLVKGAEVGRVFPLDPPEGARRQEWQIGRRRTLPIALDFDPYVSSDNAHVVWEKGAFTVQDADESRNGTTLNFALLPKGHAHRLRTGDLIGVGRSLLMMRE